MGVGQGVVEAGVVQGMGRDHNAAMIPTTVGMVGVVLGASSHEAQPWGPTVLPSGGRRAATSNAAA